MSLCFSSVLPFIFLPCLSPIVTVCLCRPCMIYNELYKATTSRQCLYKATLSTDNTAFHSLEEREFCTLLSFWRRGGRAVARGGLSHNLSLVHRAVGWCAVSVWWLLLTKKCLSSLLWANISMDRHITRNLSSELGVWGNFYVWFYFLE